MRRRDLLKIFGAAVVSPSIVLPASVRAQQPRRTKRVGVVMVNAETDPDGQVRANAFRQGLEQLGWSGSRNLQLEFRWGAGSPERAQRHATELVAWEPDAILANGTPAVAALQKATSTIPIVFAVVTDPVGAGFVQSLSYPGGNITGFSTFEPAIGNKWVELLQEIAPKTQRIACVLDPGFRGFSAIHREIESVAPKLGLAITTIGFRERSDDLEGALARFAAEPRGALVVFPTSTNNIERARIISLSLRHRMPAIFPFRHYATDGGLLAYGFDTPDLFARSAIYVDRVLKGAKPSDLPVQAPTKFELVINLRTAAALGLSVSATLTARADAVVE
jgi:putative ABC transport system substrate-binding protein